MTTVFRVLYKIQPVTTLFFLLAPSLINLGSEQPQWSSGQSSGYRTKMYCVSCEVRTEFICYVEENRPPLWSSGQSSGYRTKMYCVTCEVRTEFICYVEESRPPLWSSGQSSWLQIGDVLCFL
jgi:phosphoribosyl-AMP cyclohydrolase